MLCSSSNLLLSNFRSFEDGKSGLLTLARIAGLVKPGDILVGPGTLTARERATPV
jgi:hypothetical protein